MGFEEFVAWIRGLAERGHLTWEQAEDVIRQRALFDEQRSMLEVEYAGLAIGFIADQLVVRPGVGPLLNAARNSSQGERQLYFEEMSPPVRFGFAA
jgi:hypothetical protein